MSDLPSSVPAIAKYEVALETQLPAGWLRWLASLARGALYIVTLGLCSQYHICRVVIQERATSSVVASHHWGRNYEGALTDQATLVQELQEMTVTGFELKHRLEVP